MSKNYDEIIKHYESCLEKHGDNHLGVDWPKKEDAEKRYQVMFEISKFIDSKNVSLLDFGCGTAHFYEFLKSNGHYNISYSGLDVSQKFIDVCNLKFPEINFYCLDILETNFNQKFDIVILNGVFTEKRNLSFNEMWNYFQELIQRVFDISNKGISFNVMSKNVDWERDDLFHVPHDLLTEFLCKKLSRNYIIRNDYGLYEYTVYVLKN